MHLTEQKTQVSRPPLTEVALCNWVGAALPNDTQEYHRGFLAIDTILQWTRLPERERAELCRVARRARWLAEHGLVHLVQRRHGPQDYSYLAVARPKPRRKAVSLESLFSEVSHDCA